MREQASFPARNKKVVELPGRKAGVEVYELTFREIKQLLEMDGEASGVDALIEHVGGRVIPLLTSLKEEEVPDLTPSEARVIWDAIKEVNASFFDLLDAAGLKGFIADFTSAIIKDCSTLYAASLSGATSTLLSTDTPTSSAP